MKKKAIKYKLTMEQKANIFINHTKYLTKSFTLYLDMSRGYPQVHISLNRNDVYVDAETSLIYPSDKWYRDIEKIAIKDMGMSPQYNNVRNSFWFI